MTKAMPRRAFLKALGLAPVAVKSGAVKALIAKVEAATAMTAAGMSVGLPMGQSYGVHLLGNKGLYAAHKMGLLPDWAKTEIEAHLRMDSSGRLHPDIAVLRSVSLAAKFQIQIARQRRALWASIDEVHLHTVAREAFWNSPENRPQPPSVIPS